MRADNAVQADAQAASQGEGNDAADMETYDSLLEKSRLMIGWERYDAAAGVLLRALTLDVSRPEAYNNLGAVKEMKGDALAALKFYRAAYAFMPSFEPARSNIHRVTNWTREGDISLA